MLCGSLKRAIACKISTVRRRSQPKASLSSSFAPLCELKKRSPNLTLSDMRSR
ncbi:MAG: hypothetical protein V7K27_28795 [Nostoc sp.]|uniref:hypothetical protein n=1 Tax=Nostoc sp. TaxID=1180 RepID=UPI002FF81CA6